MNSGHNENRTLGEMFPFKHQELITHLNPPTVVRKARFQKLEVRIGIGGNVELLHGEGGDKGEEGGDTNEQDEETRHPTL